MITTKCHHLHCFRLQCYHLPCCSLHCWSLLAVVVSSIDRLIDRLIDPRKLALTMMVSASMAASPIPKPDNDTLQAPQTPKEPCYIKTTTVTNCRRIIRTTREVGTAAYAGAHTTTPTKPSKDRFHHPCPNKPRPPSSIDRIPVDE